MTTPSSPRKLYLRTFGCQMNEYDSQKIMDVLNEEHPTVLTEDVDQADIVVLNTCSIREKAQEKVFSDLGRIRQAKDKNPNMLITVGGCVASQEGQNIIHRAPYVDVVFGPQTLHRLPQLLSDKKESGKSQVDIQFPEIEKFDHMPPARVEGPSAFVSIMEGCSKYCTFCVVPYTRGPEISRPLDDVLIEIADLADQGVKEVNLLGQNVNAYLGAIDDKGSVADFALLLEYINDIPGIERIRFTTSHPKEMTPRLIDAYARLPKLATFLHLPVQSGSDKILMAMKRGYTALEYKSIIRKLRAIRPDMSISSDFIVGFPGETADDFEKTMQLIQEVHFDQSYSFIYSRRPGTPAAELEDNCPKEEKQARLYRLQETINQQAHTISQSMIHTIQRLVVEGPSKRNPEELMGRTENNRIVNFPGQKRLIGQMVNVRITETMTFTLRGEVVTQAPSDH